MCKKSVLKVRVTKKYSFHLESTKARVVPMIFDSFLWDNSISSSKCNLDVGVTLSSVASFVGYVADDKMTEPSKL